jgi:hypothetical protein
MYDRTSQKLLRWPIKEAPSRQCNQTVPAWRGSVSSSVTSIPSYRQSLSPWSNTIQFRIVRISSCIDLAMSITTDFLYYLVLSHRRSFFLHHYSASSGSSGIDFPAWSRYYHLYCYCESSIAYLVPVNLVFYYCHSAVYACAVFPVLSHRYNLVSHHRPTVTNVVVSSRSVASVYSRIVCHSGIVYEVSPLVRYRNIPVQCTSILALSHLVLSRR